jgi:hypothetical protein
MATFEKNPRDAVIVASVRSAIGKGKRGTLAQTRPDDLMAQVIRAALDKVPAVKDADIEDVIIGCATPEAEQGLNVGRNAALMAGLPDEVPAETVNRFCSSGLQTIAHAAERIKAGWADIIVAGGVESMSLLPMGGHHILPNPEFVVARPEAYVGMGLTAELVAERYEVSRADQDAFSLKSHEKALAAQAANRYADEIVPVQATVFGADGPTKVAFATDEGPRAGSTVEGLGKLKSPFKNGGSVTAASSSQVSDGRGPRAADPRRAPHVLGRRRPAGDHGHRPGQGHPQGAGEGRPHRRRHRHLRGERGVREPGGVLPARARHPRQQAQPERGGHRARAPARLHRSADDGHPAARDGEAGQQARGRLDVHRRRDGRGCDLRARGVTRPDRE